MDNLDGTSLDGSKKWRCNKNKNHILGVIERVQVSIQVNGATLKYHTTRLIIFRKAVDLTMEIPAEIEVAGEIDDRMLSMVWKCSMPGCDCIKEWHPDEEALEWLHKRLGRETQAERSMEVRDG
jgi:hypothetical protein